jgi:kynurenine formamidase
MPRSSRPLLDADGFTALAQRLTRGTVPSAPEVLTAVGLVREGRVVSAGEAPAEPGDRAAEARGTPGAYRLTHWTEHGAGWSARNERFELDVHGAGSMTHLDSTEHFAWDAAAGPAPETISRLAARGLVARGVLIDVPGLLGDDLEGRVVTLADLEHAAERTGVRPEPGDALYLSFGRRSPARADVPLGSEPTAGLSIECADWLAAASPSVIVTDEGLDPAPSEVAGQPVPWHLLVLTVLGIPLVDRAMLAPLATTCLELGRWEFLSVIAPLSLPGASGSPVNPLAIF